jgi:hypothetical protein
MLLEVAQRDLPKEKLESLMVEKETTHCVSGAERALLVVSARTIVCRSYFIAQGDFTAFLHHIERKRMCVSSKGCKKMKYCK